MNYAVLATINAQGVTDSRMQTLRNVRDALPGVALAGLQEVKNLRGDWSLRERLSRRTIGVAQVTRTEATSGVALVWDKSRVRPVPGSRRIVLGASAVGHHMLNRHLLAADFRIDRAITITGIVGHRPPARYRDLWPEYDAALAHLLADVEHPAVLFTDNNSVAVPHALASGYEVQRSGIDFIAVGDDLTVLGDAFLLPKTGSDHRPVALKVRVS